MEEVGRLAGGIAHDFNNLLTAILGYADLVADQLPAKSDLVSDIDQIRKAGLSASSLTRQLLAFSRRQMLKPEVICINDVVTRTETLLRRVIGEHIVFSTRLDPALGHANVDPGQIEQVILNLAVNAGDAMPEGGALTLETGNLMIDREFAAAHDGAKPGPHIMLKVTDTGAGMSADVRKQIFEPFFTTKEKTKGTARSRDGLRHRAAVGRQQRVDSSQIAGQPLRFACQRSKRLRRSREEPTIPRNGTVTIFGGGSGRGAAGR